MVMTDGLSLHVAALARVHGLILLGTRYLQMDVGFLLHLGRAGLIHLLKFLVRISRAVFTMTAKLAAAPMYAAVYWIFVRVSSMLPFMMMVSSRKLHVVVIVHVCRRM